MRDAKSPVAMKTSSVLISGIGVAGPAVAYWLSRFGFVPTLVERAPRLREGGYAVDFWGAGYDLADKMGALPEILAAGYQIEEARVVGRDGRRITGIPAAIFRDATGSRFTTVPRDALSAALFHLVEDRVETVFGDSVTALERRRDGVHVQFERSAPRRFDLVVGADGQHSAIRRLAFGPEDRFERYLGYTVAAFSTTGYQPRADNVYIAYTRPGRQIARFAMRDDRTMFLFVVADDLARDIGDLAARKQYLRDHFADAGWECPEILAAMAGVRDLYFDRVSQIVVDRWSTGSIGLVGDAAYAPSLVAGQGSALAIIGAYVMAGELALATTPRDGLVAYERRLRDFIDAKQRAAARFASWFAPATRLGVFVRNQLTKAFAWHWVAKRAFASDLMDAIELPDYPQLVTRAVAQNGAPAIVDHP
jgi:2-polyprenyl-6-methoxyphenol hydroxylase-like FAD-dependent oxidoreductase